ncbi:MAG: SAM-dependent chlorinase/fluorinase [Planctomycetes bacterium]|nr:SAM-dependent chlorinase/fluorinase [Planctomycetota bacterium]
MSPPVITLTTDFGRASPYVAVMKGVILSVNPAARVLDLTHEIRPQNVRHASYFLGTAVPYFPPGTIHVCVVDPGVGSERAALYADTPEQRLVGPDNGVFTEVFRKLGRRAAGALTVPRFWRTPHPSDTFHGRDIFAPVAAHLSLGTGHLEIAPVNITPVELPTRSAVTFGKKWNGEVLFVDDFGNLITNVPACKLKALPLRVTLGGSALGAVRWVRTYSEAAPGELVCLFSSDGYFELAEVNGDAARRLSAHPGDAVELEQP